MKRVLVLVTALLLMLTLAPTATASEASASAVCTPFVVEQPYVTKQIGKTSMRVAVASNQTLANDVLRPFSVDFHVGS